MTIVPQYNDFSCVAACLESFLKDNGENFDHEQFVKDNISLFSEREWCEGSCDSGDFDKIAALLGLTHEQIFTPWFTATPPNEAIFLHVQLNEDKSKNHFVRFNRQIGDKVEVMNPERKDALDEMPVKWIRGIHKFTKQ